MPDSLEDRVKATYRRHFEHTRNWADSWNRTLDDISGSYDPEASDEYHVLRRQIVEILMKERQAIELSLGDHFALALDAAMRDLKRDKVLEWAVGVYKKDEQDREARIRDKHKLELRLGPKEWSPKRDLKKEQVERLVEKDREGREDARLYIMFDKKGGFLGVRIDYPQYWQWHNGPVASIVIHESMDWREIEREVGDALSELDWKEIGEELEEENGA